MQQSIDPKDPSKLVEYRSAISPEKRKRILELTELGTSIKKTCELAEVSWATITRLIRVDPLFSEQWRTARDVGADALSDLLCDLYDNCVSTTDVAIARGKSENIKTTVAWRSPHKYGPRVDINVNHTVDLSGALNDAEKRAIPILAATKMDGFSAGLGIEEKAKAMVLNERYAEMDALRVKAREQISSMPVIDAELYSEREIEQEQEDTDDGVDKYL